MRTLLAATSFSCFVSIGVYAQTQDTVTGREFFENIGVDFETVELKIESVSPGLHVLRGAGGNVVVSIGDHGALMVDDNFQVVVPKIKKAIDQLGGGDIDFVINTHWHFDHTGGNQLLSHDGSWIVSHTNSRQMLMDRQLVNLVSAVVEQSPSPNEALPIITYDDRMQFHFNGGQIDLLYFGPAHTTGDTAVFFRRHNAVHMGDVFFSRSYPFIDVDNGGSLDGVIRFCEGVLQEIREDTVVIPGHGPLATYADLKGYIEMLRTIRHRIARLVADNATLDEVIAAKPTADWDADWRNSTRFLDRAYAELTK